MKTDSWTRCSFIQLKNEHFTVCNIFKPLFISFQMHSGSGSMGFKQNSAVSVYIGIASLVLEGRVISTDEDDDDAFSKKFDSKAVQSQFPNAGASSGSSSSGSSTSRYGVIHRISEKLMRLRQFPDSNKDDVGSMAIPVQFGDDCDYDRQPRLLASAREFQRNARLTTLPTSSVSNSSSAASVLHDIDVDWNDISILFNGLDSLVNMPGSPIKLSANHSFRASLAGHLPIPMNQEPSFKLFKSKEKATTGKSTAKPKHGPHCEKFLKKIGILKLDSPELESDHMCNHASGYVSSNSWQSLFISQQSFRCSVVAGNFISRKCCKFSQKAKTLVLKSFWVRRIMRFYWNNGHSSWLTSELTRNFIQVSISFLCLCFAVRRRQQWQFKLCAAQFVLNCTSRKYRRGWICWERRLSTVTRALKIKSRISSAQK